MGPLPIGACLPDLGLRLVPLESRCLGEEQSSYLDSRYLEQLGELLRVDNRVRDVRQTFTRVERQLGGDYAVALAKHVLGLSHVRNPYLYWCKCAANEARKRG